LFIYLALAIAYSLVVPIGRGADEWAHYWYAQFIAQTGRLPANPVEREAAGYKSDWPPLYHLLVASLTSWIETEGPPTFKYRQGLQGNRDNIRRQLVSAQGPEAILHTEDELFPWQQEILVWHIGRFLSLVFSLGTLLVTYLMALEVFGMNVIGARPGSRSRTLALVSVALLAFNPRFLFTGMLFNYDGLTLLLSSLFLWLSIRVAIGFYPHWGLYGLGLLAGLALATKYLTVLLPSIIVIVAAWRSRDETTASHAAPFLRRFSLRIGQALLAFLLVTVWWFGYLIINFNEMDTYGPVLGALAPLIRGDGSDRAVEEIFAFLSGGQAPAPAYIEKQSYSAWRIMAELPTTFWGNAVVYPYPLNWFIITMTTITGVAALGLIMTGFRLNSIGNLPPNITRPPQLSHNLIYLLLLYCALPLPFMLIRLFGARDALEAVQGRHILFLAGPAVVILMVWGLSASVLRSAYYVLRKKDNDIIKDDHAPRTTFYVLRFTFYVLLAILLSGAIGQLIFMGQAYPPPLPVRAGPYREAQTGSLSQPIRLEGGAHIIDYDIIANLSGGADEQTLHVIITWQAGETPALEDYQMELALVDEPGETRASWRAYQTQARYPTRAWEPDDIIRDEGWLPLAGLAAGEYEVRLRILGESGPVVDWQTLAHYTLRETVVQPIAEARWILWRQGKVMYHVPVLRERETAQFTFTGLSERVVAELAADRMVTHPAAISISPLELMGPDERARGPISAGATWANFIIGPEWPPGDYYIGEQVVFSVAESQRNFKIPEIPYPLAANFEGKIKLLGYDLPSRRVEPGDGLPITLHWQGLQWMGEEFVIFDRLLDNQQLAWGGYDRLAQENYSTLLWAPGEIVADGFAIPVDPKTPDGVYWLMVGWYRQVAGKAESLPILNPETDQPTGETAVSIGPIKVGGPPAGVTVAQADPQVELNQPFGSAAELILLGYTMVGQNDKPIQNSKLETQTLKLILYWRSQAVLPIDYTTFVHLRNAAGEIIAQMDRPPADGVYPTSLWDAGEIIKDEILVPLNGLPSGRYEVVVGLYDFETGVRLPVAGASSDSVALLSFEHNGF
jgi:hypothetical protein